ncbi:MAG: hypoxanthine phosphoribosyltransferase [Tidjanibacter sp.]|nr:hypoxanthine phosphoribosyltransferase [Tidjanibacter sp.]
MSQNNKPRVTLHDKTFELSIPHAEIAEAVQRVADRLNEDYKGVDTPLFLGVLNGAFMFMGELMPRIDLTCEVQFVKIASYVGTASTGKVQDLIGINGSVEGRHIIIVEDVVDTGESMEHMLEMLKGYKPASVAIATLLYKPTKFTKSYEVKYRAMDIPDDFIVGFGLDYNDIGRNLKDIYTIVNE